MKGMGKLGTTLVVAAMLISPLAGAAPGDVQVAPYRVATPGITPDVALTPDGTAIHVWVNDLNVNDPNTVRARIYAPAGAPGAVFSISGQRSNLTRAPSVAVDAAGNFVVAWEEMNPANSIPHRIFFRRFAANQTALSPVLAVDDGVDPAMDQVSPDVSMNAQGQFAISWGTLRHYASKTGLLRLTQGPIMVRRYDSAGIAGSVQKVSDRQSGEMPVITPTVYAVAEFAGQIQYASQGPSVSIDNAGATVVAWTAGFRVAERTFSLLSTSPLLGGGVQAVYAQRFDAGGLVQGKRIEIASALTSAHETYDAPAVAWTPDGGFVVAFDRNDALRSAVLARGIYFKRVDATGKPARTATEVARGPSAYCCDRLDYYDGAPALAAHSSGAFAIAWRDFEPEQAQQSVSPSISTRVYASDGSALGEATHLASENVTSRPSIAMRGNGDYLVNWSNYNFDIAGPAVNAARIDGP